MNLFSGLIIQSSSFTRPGDTTQYTAGDLVANNTVSSSVTPLSFAAFASRTQHPAKSRRVRIDKSTSVTASATFAVHFYEASPTQGTSGDNSAILPSARDKYLGSVSAISVANRFGDGAAGWGVLEAGAEICIAYDRTTSGTIYGLVEATAAYPPGNAEVFKVSVEFTP